jgi:hypothetical protein
MIFLQFSNRYKNRQKDLVSAFNDLFILKLVCYFTESFFKNFFHIQQSNGVRKKKQTNENPPPCGWKADTAHPESIAFTSFPRNCIVVFFNLNYPFWMHRNTQLD